MAIDFLHTDWEFILSVSQNLYYKQNHEPRTLLLWVGVVKSCNKQSKWKDDRINKCFRNFQYFYGTLFYWQIMIWCN